MGLEALLVSAFAGTGITAAGVISTIAKMIFSSVISSALAPRKKKIPPKIEVSQRDPVAPRQIVYGTCRVGGTVVFMNTRDKVTTTIEDHPDYEQSERTVTEKNKYLDFVVVVAAHEVNAIREIYFDDYMAWQDGTYQVVREGSSNPWSNRLQITVFDGTQTTAHAELVDAYDDYTSDHKLLGCAYVHLRFEFDQGYYPTGVPGLSFVVEGKPVYDPRKDSTSDEYDSSLGVSTHRSDDSTTWEHTSNPALCLRDYLTDSFLGMGIPESKIDDASFHALADLAEEQVDYSASDSHNRYSLDGKVNMSNNPEDIIRDMLSTFNGELLYSGGKFFVSGGQYIAPTITLTEDNMFGELNITTARPRSDTFNAVKGVFFDEDNNFIETDYPAQTSSTFQTEDGGDQIFVDHQLPMTTNNFRAQRLARMSLKKSRDKFFVTGVFDMSAIRLKVGDTVTINHSRYFASGKIFKIQSWEMLFDADGAIKVELGLLEENSDRYNFDYTTEQGDVTVVSAIRSTPIDVEPPTEFINTETTRIAADGSILPAFQLNWIPSQTDSVDRYELQYRRTLPTPAEPLSTTLFVYGQQYVITNVVPGATYEIKIRAYTSLGTPSAFATLTETVTGDTTAPGIPTVNDIIKSDNKITLEFVAPADLDTSRVDIFRVDDSRNIAASTGFGAMGSSPSGSGETVTDPSLRESPVTPDANTEPSVSVDATPGRIGYAVFNNVDNERIHFFFLRSRDHSGNVSDWSSVVRSIPEEEFQRGATKGAPDIVNDPEFGGNGKIKVGLVVADSIEAGAVTAEKIDVNDLSAINADIGDITAGTLKGGTVPDANDVPSGAETGAFLNLTDGKFVFGSADHNILFDGTDLKINGDIITNLGGTSNNRIVYDGDIMDITGTLSSDEFTSGYTLAASTSTTLDRKLDSQTGDFYGYWDVRDSSGNSLTLTNLESIQDGDFLYFNDGLIVEQVKVEGSSRFRLEWSSDYYIEFSLGEFFRSFTPRYVRGKITVVTARSSTKDFADVSGVDADVITGRRYDYDPADSRGWILKNSGDVEAQAITAKEINQLYIHNHLATNIVIGTTTTLDQVTSGRDNIVIGDGAGGSTTTGSDNIYIGKEAGSQADGGADNNVIIGNETKFFGTGFTESAVIGYRAHGVGYRTVALGFQAKAGTYIDASTYTEADYSVAIGTSSTVTGESGIAIGNSAYTTGQDGVALGYTATASGTDSIAIGDATASGNDSIAIGNGVTASANNSIKIGTTQTAVTIGAYDLSAYLTSGGDLLIGDMRIREGTGKYIFSITSGGTETDVFSIDTSGNMILAGTLTENGTP